MMELTKCETWAPALGFETHYEVSSMGRVRSMTRTYVSRFGGLAIKKSIILKLKKRGNGYLEVCFWVDNAKHYVLVHRLVAQTFLQNPEGLPQVNHKNGIKSDNRVENLEWVTPKENIKHARENDLVPTVKGSDHYSTSMCDAQVVFAAQLYYNSGCTTVEAASLLGVHRKTFSDIINGKTWKHLQYATRNTTNSQFYLN